MFWPEYGEEGGGGFDWFAPPTDFSSEFNYRGDLADLQNTIVVDVDTDANGVMSHFQVHKIDNVTLTVVSGEDMAEGTFTMAIHSRAIVNNQIVQGPSAVATVDAEWFDLKLVNPDGSFVPKAHVKTNLIHVIR